MKFPFLPAACVAISFFWCGCASQSVPTNQFLLDGCRPANSGKLICKLIPGEPDETAGRTLHLTVTARDSEGNEVWKDESDFPAQALIVTLKTEEAIPSPLTLRYSAEPAKPERDILTLRLEFSIRCGTPESETPKPAPVPRLLKTATFIPEHPRPASPKSTRYFGARTAEYGEEVEILNLVCTGRTPDMPSDYALTVTLKAELR